MYFLVKANEYYFSSSVFRFSKFQLRFSGLFKGAVQQSGSSIDVWAYKADCNTPFNYIKNAMNLKSTEPAEICEELTYEYTAEDVNCGTFKIIAETSVSISNNAHLKKTHYDMASICKNKKLNSRT